MRSEKAKHSTNAFHRLIAPFLNLAFLRFIAAGVVNTGVDWSAFYLLVKHAQLNPTVSKSISVFLGMTSAYTLNALWVFRPQFLSRWSIEAGKGKRLLLIGATYLQTLLAYALGMGLNVGTFAAVRAFGLVDLLSLSIATAVSFLSNYLFTRKIFSGIIRFGGNGGNE